MRKEAVIFSVLFVLVLGNVLLISANFDDVMFGVSGTGNAHGENWLLSGGYTPLNYSVYYGWSYVKANPHLGGLIMMFSDTTNAHAQIPADVCAGIVKECVDYGHGEETECNSQLGCYFNKTGWDECERTAVKCQEFNDSTTCNNQIGCGWINRGVPYNTEIRYGDLVCRGKNDSEGPCDRPNEKCIVRLSNWTNAHLSNCVSNNYPIQLCCISYVDCKQFTTKSGCNLHDTCAWTPILNETTGIKTTSNADGGGCCPFGEEWNQDTGCGPTFNLLCNNAWTVNSALEIKSEPSNFTKYVRSTDTGYEYCAQVTPGITTGYWQPVEKY
jgi:hypothetical protein